MDMVDALSCKAVHVRDTMFGRQTQRLELRADGGP
jgi:hypothetical protein